MTIRRKLTDTMADLEERINEVIKRATTGQSNQAGDTINDRLVVWFETVRTELNKWKELFPRLKICEEELMSKFNSLEQEMYLDIFDKDSQKDKMDKLTSMGEKLDSIKTLVDSIGLPTILPTQSSKPPDPSELAQVRKLSEDWKTLTVEEDILDSTAMTNLQLSYDVLDIQLKLCLLCFAIFPEKAVIKKMPLIYWWIGEGLITKSKDKTAQDEGERIFMELIDKGLIEPVCKNTKSPIVDSCRMHPWIHRMLVSVAKRAEFFDFTDTGEIADDYSKSRRACLFSGKQGFSVNNNNARDQDELLTMFNVNEQYLNFGTELLSKFKRLVILQLGRWQNSAKHHIEVEHEVFLNELWAQKHLKYLSLQGISRITALPSSVVECINLEILDLRACHNLETLPSDIGSLRKLTHLDISECYLLESMPKGLEKLSLLQVLKGFVIGQSRKNPCTLGDLAQLKKLRKLSIQIGSDAVIEEGELNKLEDFENLRVLTITWGGVASPSKQGEQLGTKTNANAGRASLRLTRTATLTMKFFAFPKKLAKLDLRCLPRRGAPEWLNASNLENCKKLYIRGGEIDGLVYESNKKWKVEVLRLKYLKNLKIEGQRLEEHFPDLIYFEKIRCRQIAEKQYEEDVEWNKAEGWDELKQALVKCASSSGSIN